MQSEPSNAEIAEVDRDRREDTLTVIDYRVISKPMSSESFLDRALHAIGDPTRRRILQILKENRGSDSKSRSLCGGDIEERIHLSQPTVSHHMAILTKAGLVEGTKEGQWRWYRRNEKAIRQVVRNLRGKL